MALKTTVSIALTFIFSVSVGPVEVWSQQTGQTSKNSIWFYTLGLRYQPSAIDSTQSLITDTQPWDFSVAVDSLMLITTDDSLALNNTAFDSSQSIIRDSTNSVLTDIVNGSIDVLPDDWSVWGHTFKAALLDSVYVTTSRETVEHIIADGDTIVQSDSLGTILGELTQSGLHRFDFRKLGYKTVTSLIDIKTLTTRRAICLYRYLSLRVHTYDVVGAGVIVDSVLVGETIANNDSALLEITNLLPGQHSLYIYKDGYVSIDTVIQITEEEQIVSIELKPLTIDISDQASIVPEEVLLIHDPPVPEDEYPLSIRCAPAYNIQPQSLTVHFNDRDATTHCRSDSNGQIVLDRIRQLKWAEGMNVISLGFKDFEGINRTAVLSIQGTRENTSPVDIWIGDASVDSTIASNTDLVYWLKDLLIIYDGPVDHETLQITLNDVEITRFFSIEQSEARLSHPRPVLPLHLHEYNLIKVSIDHAQRGSSERREFSLSSRKGTTRFRLTDFRQKVNIGAIELDPTKESGQVNLSIWNIEKTSVANNSRILGLFSSVRFNLRPFEFNTFTFLPGAEELPDGLVQSDDWFSPGLSGSITLAMVGKRGFVDKGGFEVGLVEEVKVFYAPQLYVEKPPQEVKALVPAAFVENFIGIMITNLNTAFNGASLSLGLGSNGLFKHDRFPRFKVNAYMPFNFRNNLFYLRFNLDTSFNRAAEIADFFVGYSYFIPTAKLWFW